MISKRFELKTRVNVLRAINKAVHSHVFRGKTRQDKTSKQTCDKALYWPDLWLGKNVYRQPVFPGGHPSKY